MLIKINALLITLLTTACVDESEFLTPEPTAISNQQYKDIDKYFWNYILPVLDADSDNTPKTIIKCVEFWQFLSNRDIEPGKRAEMVLPIISNRLSIGKYIFPDIRSVRLSLLQDFINFIDKNRTLRTINIHNLLYRMIKLEDFKLMHPILQKECIDRLNVVNFVQELMGGAQIVIFCEKIEPIENIFVLMIKPQSLINNTKEDEVREKNAEDSVEDKNKLLCLPESKIFYNILSLSSYPYSHIN